MSSSLTSRVHNSVANTITINSTRINPEMMSDVMSEPSSPDSSFDASELIGPGINRIEDEVTSQLQAAGPVGVAAAAAINTNRGKKRNHMFETNPSVRRRQQTRLLRKLKACIEEYTTRVGQQAVVLCCTPSKSISLNSYKVFGSQPLENVMKNCKSAIMQDLDVALAEHAPPNSDVSLTFELPQLALDGIPTPVDKMNQAQLRTFIPEMLKYSTGRSKPAWGKSESRPVWWPNDVPWANVRSDVRTEEEKKRVSWTEALKSIVRNCYKHHGREDLLNIFGEEGAGAETQPAFLGTMVQTINNPDGTVSIIQIDTGPNSVVTLPDGTQATVVHSMTAIPQENINHVSQDVTGGLQTMETTLTTQQAPEVHTNHSVVEIPGGAPFTISGGRIILANGETASLTTDPATGVMSIPVSIYQSLQQQGTLDIGSTGQMVFTQATTTQQVQQPQIMTQQQLEQLQQQQTLQQHLEAHQGIVQEGDPLGVQLTQHHIQGAGGDSVECLITAGTVAHKTEPS